MFRRTKTAVMMSLVLSLTAGVSTVARADDDPVSSDPPPSVATEAPTPTTIKVVIDTEPEPASTAPRETDPPETAPPSTEAHPASTEPEASDDTTPTATTVAQETPTETTVKHSVDINPDSDPCSWQVSCPATSAPDTGVPTSTGDSASSSPSSVPVVTPTTNAQVTHDQQTVVTGTQVSGSNSGGNNVVAGGTPGVINTPSGAIDTGDAAAVGSMDQNTILQAAQIALTDQAVANLLQIALILNVGAGFANSGANNVSASPDGNGVTGQVGTGNATAIGNDLQAYITQAANANANSAMNDDTSQQALSLFLGLAIANSGLNSVTGTGTAGSGGGVGTGDATAIGNNSVTGITQLATLMGADAAKLTVQQRATVLNLGFALANTGLNDVSGVAAGLLAAGDDQDDALALQLFTMLLPALLQSFGYGPGAGSIGTGNANAIGNQSQTQVLQQAGATATGDGEVNMSQDVLVANMGGAAANTGGNSLGSARTLDPQTASAVVQMAAFLSKMLSIVHHNSDAANALTTADNQTMEIPFGDLILTVEGAISGLDQQFRYGEAQANVRQISVVISLGVAQANSGLNTSAVLSDSNLLSAVNAALPQLVQTGDADSRNKTLVIICQRIDADDVECLKPPPPPADDPEETTTTTTVPVDPGTIIDGPIIATPVPDPYTTGTATWIDEGAKTSGLEVPPLSGLMTPQHAQALPSTGSDPMLPMEIGAVLIFVGLVFLTIRRKAGTVQNR